MTENAIIILLCNCCQNGELNLTKNFVSRFNGPIFIELDGFLEKWLDGLDFNFI